MKKRILSIALVLCMLLSVMPTAFATGNASVYIGDTQYTENGTQPDENSGVTISWSTRTITLNNVNLTPTITNTESIVMIGETFVAVAGITINDSNEWSITLIGTNTITATESLEYDGLPCCGVYSVGPMTISGEGSLTVTAPSYGLVSGGNMTISGGTLTISNMTGKNGASIYSMGDISITGGSVAAQNSLTKGYGIMASGSISISGTANVTASSGNAGLYALLSNVTISGGTVTATGTNDATGGGGIFTNMGNVMISGGTVIASGGRYGIYGNAVTISAGTITANATGSNSSKKAVRGSTVAISTGTYNTALTDGWVTSGYWVDTSEEGKWIVKEGAPSNWVARIGENYYVGDTALQSALDTFSTSSQSVNIYLNENADVNNAAKTGLTPFNQIIIWVPNGTSFDTSKLTLNDSSWVTNCATGNSETIGGVTYHSYVYTVSVSPDAAFVMVKKADGTVVGYYEDFGSTALTGDAMHDASAGDTFVLLKDLTEIAVNFPYNATLDLNGHTLATTANSVPAGVQTGANTQLTIVDSSNGQGKITANDNIALGGNFIINGGTIEGATDQHSIMCWDGYSITINGGTLVGDIFTNGDNSVVEIYGGDFTQSGFAPGCRGKVLVSGTTISGYCGDDENDTDVTWTVEPTTGTITVNGKTLTNLKLTLSGDGVMNDYEGTSDRTPWWSMREQITEVVVNCSDLGNYALADLNEVTSLTLSEGLTSIGNYAFQNTPINNALTIPASVTSIGNNAFENCGVTAFSVAGGSSFTAENGVLLNSGKTTIVAYPDGAAQFAAYTAPSTVTSIAPGAFSGSEVKSIIISGTLTSAFYLPTFENTDKYNFEGWYSNADFSGDRITNTTGSAYAKWVSTVTFDANGGTLENYIYSVAHSTVIGELPTPTWTDDTKEFASWNTQADGLGTTVTAETVPTGNVTYYAIYKIKNSDVVINPIPNQTYTGSAITPHITYKIGDGDVQTITDAVWSSNTNVGTASTTVTINNQQYPVTFQITKATYDMSGITFENDTVTYDGQAHSLAISGNLPDGVTVSYEGNDQTNAGTYTVTAKFAGDADNYEAIEDMTATLTINKARLTITAHDKTMYVGDDVPTLTYTVTGLVEGEALTREPDVSCTALGDTAGNFAIRVSGATASSNYWSVITYVDGTLSVENRPVVPSGPAILPSVPSNNVTVEDIENGTIKVTPSYATKGQTVTITVTPDSGYELDELVVLDKNGIAVELTKKSDNQYSFKMPSGKVTVEATFVEAVIENPFVDVAENDYYYDAVLWAVENGITTGTGDDTFSPNAVCTRAQVVTFLWRAAGCPEPAGAVNAFDDIEANAYYAKAVQWAVEQGITDGTGDNKFSPDAECTRGQIVTFLWRSQGFENATANNPFVDVADGAYYEDAVLWAVEEAITNGTGADTFSPDADCTRGQIVTFLYRCLAE